MAGIQLSGLASGLDTASIIDSLMAVERQPRTRIEMRQAQEQARRDGLNQVTTQLKALQDAATALRSTGTWADTQSVTSNDATKVAVTRTGGAGPGGYDIAVTRLASSTQRTYTYAPPAAGTNLTFTVKDAQGADVPTTIPLAAGASLDDAVSTINTTAGSPVYAVNVAGKLVLASRATGENARFTMADSAGGTLTQESERLGQKSLIKVDGVDYASETNTVTGAIPGVSLTLKGLTDSVQVDVGAPGPDQSALADKVKAFTNAYNTVVDSIRAKVTEKPVANATTADPGEDRRPVRRRRAEHDPAPAAPGRLRPDRRQRGRARRDGRARRQHRRRVLGDQRRLRRGQADLRLREAHRRARRRPAGRAQAARRHHRHERLRAAHPGHPRPGLGHERRPVAAHQLRGLGALEHRERPHRGSTSA